MMCCEVPMIINYEESKNRDAYLDGDVVFYMDHDIPIKKAGQFLEEIAYRAKPDEITITQQIKKGKVKFADKWIQNGWRLFCYDDYETSFKYNIDIRFERLVDGHFRRWFIFIHEKSLRLFLDKSFAAKPECTWGEFVEKEHTDDEKLSEQIGGILTEAAKYIVPFFHSTKIIAATNKVEYAFLEDLLKAGESLDRAAGTFSKYFKLPLWGCEFRKMEDL